MTGAIRLLVLAAAIAAGTWAGGWSAVPLVAFLWGAWRREERSSPLLAGLAAVIGWGALLVISGIRGPVLTIADRVGGLAGLPGVAIVAATLLFAFGLAWSAAEVARALMLLSVRRAAAEET
jgi:hypothetical protein